MTSDTVTSITPAALRERLARNEEIFLVDVREPYEHEAYNIGGTLIPLGQLIEQHQEIPKDTTVVVYCQKGIRSQIAIQRLQQKFDFRNLINLSGGMNAWRSSEEGSK